MRLPLMLYSLEIFTSIQPTVGILLISPHDTSRQRINDNVRDDLLHTSSNWSCKKAIILFLALVWTCFVHHNGRDTMNEDIGAYRPFLWCFVFVFIVLVFFWVGSFILFPATLDVVSDRLRDDLPKTAFQNSACSSEKCRTSRHHHIR